MSEHSEMDRATFTAMTQGTQADWQKIATAAMAFNGELADRVLAHLQMLKGDCGGFLVDRLEHSLQAATLAYRDRMDEEYVVCALLHDMGDILASTNHAELAATVLKPFVSDENWWLLQHHGIFQGYYFFHYLGLDRNMREQFRGHGQAGDGAAEALDLSAHGPKASRDARGLEPRASILPQPFPRRPSPRR
ncbi:MAG TPA: HD domain-containing protein [Steroidobacteraceae bacterium]|nr:HD domain-containing protein [Steroidobacteraceae bacterium]